MEFEFDIEERSWFLDKTGVGSGSVPWFSPVSINKIVLNYYLYCRMLSTTDSGTTVIENCSFVCDLKRHFINASF